MGKILKERGISELILVGYQTNMCDQATALDALKLGYKVVFLEDAMAAQNPKLHQDAVGLVKSKGASVVTTEDWLKIK